MSTLPTLWTIYWMTQAVSCNGWGLPVVSDYYPKCPLLGTIETSICPATFKGFSDPYSQGRPITIIGYTLTQILPTPQDSGYAVIGSWHQANGANDGADVFGMTGGVGTHATTQTLGAGLPQGGPNSHIDIYGVCEVGPQQFLVKIDYTSP